MVALGCDHGGYDLKESLIAMLEEKGISYKDFGCFNKESCDYPEFARQAALSVAVGECDKGIVICTTGIGVSITANKIEGVRAALCFNEDMARLTREHNNANVLALGAMVTDVETSLKIAEVFLNTDFSNDERHIRRINKIEE